MQYFNIKTVKWWICFLKKDGLEWCGLLMFLSALWTLILTAPIHCRGSIGEQEYNVTFLKMCSKFFTVYGSDEKTNSHPGWPEAE